MIEYRMIEELIPKIKQKRLRVISLQEAIEKCPKSLIRSLGAPILFLPSVCILLFRQGFLEPPFFWYKKIFDIKPILKTFVLSRSFQG